MESLRNHRTPYVKSVRALTPADLEHLRAPAQRPTVQKLRDAHHNVARLLALGLHQADVAARTGYSLGRINQLAADPSVQELVASYRGQVDEAWAEGADEFISLHKSNMMKAARMVSETLDAADEPLPIRSLMSIISDGADRFGYEKRSTSLNVNVDFAAKLERAIARSGKELELRKAE